MISFKSFLQLTEASYSGNIGVMELTKFYQKATPQQIANLKALIGAKKTKEAWQLVQDVVGVKLHASYEARHDAVLEGRPERGLVQGPRHRGFAVLDGVAGPGARCRGHRRPAQGVAGEPRRAHDVRPARRPREVEAARSSRNPARTMAGQIGIGMTQTRFGGFLLSLRNGRECLRCK